MQTDLRMDFSSMTERARIVIVDDDSDLRELLVRLLGDDGHEVVEMPNGDKLLAYLGTYTVDLLILDVMLPGEDGMSLCRQVRAEGRDIPIIMLTAKIEESDRVHGLELGADDYVLKPFSGPELQARVRATLRRARGTVTAPVVQEYLLLGWIFRPIDMELIADDGLSVALSSSETELLLILVRQPMVSLSRLQLMELTNRVCHEESGRSIDTLVGRLRRKLRCGNGEELIKTVWGRGYMLATTPQSR